MKFTATTPIYMLFCMLSIVTAVAIPDAAAVGGTGVTPAVEIYKRSPILARRDEMCEDNIGCEDDDDCSEDCYCLADGFCGDDGDDDDDDELV